MYVCVCVSVCVYECAVYMYMCKCMYTRVCMCMCVHACLRMYLHVYVYECARVSICICVSTSMYTHVCISVYMYMYVCACVCVRLNNSPPKDIQVLSPGTCGCHHQRRPADVIKSMTLRWGRLFWIIQVGLNGIISVLITRRRKDQRREQEKRDGSERLELAEGPQPRNMGGLCKLKKTGKWVLLRSLQEEPALPAP